VVLVLSLSFAGCGNGGVELSLYFSDHNPPGNAMADALDAYAAYIKAESGGTIDIEVRHQGTGIDEGDVWSEIPSDDSIYAAAHYVPEITDGPAYIQVMSLPFMGWPDVDVLPNPHFPDAGPPAWPRMYCMQTAGMIYNMLLGDYSAEILGDFPASVQYVASYMMPPTQLNYYAEGLNITSPDDLASEGINSMLCMEAGVASILGELGVTGDVQDLVPIMTGVANGMDDGFAQHLEFCAFFGLLQYLKSHTCFEGGLVMVPIGILWNTSKYDACVAQLTAAGANATAVMTAAADVWHNSALEGTLVDTAAAGSYINAHGDQTVVSINTTQIADLGWAGNVSGYISDWETACSNSTKAHEIYLKALWYIANFDMFWPPF
jgi:hypothetical protein